jgi:type VI secretion system secreted protein Hcp
MAEAIWMTVKGVKQGDIKSETATKGREGMMECLEFNFEVKSPTDPGSGKPTGKRMYEPLVVCKRVDKASPLLSAALTTNESLSTVKLLFWRPDNAGKSEQFYTIELTNALLCGQEIYLPMTIDKEFAHFPVMEKLKFSFQKIVWTYTNGGITATDDWETPA